MKILIVGGGIAGMALAALLKKKGIAPLIVDTAPEWRHIGFGIYLWRNGRSVLQEIGIEHHLLGKEYLIPGVLIKNRHGQLLKQVPFSFFGAHRPTSIHRADLHEGLRSAIADVPVRFHTTITALEQDKVGVRVTFNDGAVDTFDLVVGADGIHSAVRNLALPPTRLQPYGWRTWVFWADDWAGATEEAQAILAPGQAIAALPLRDRHFVMLSAVCPPGQADTVETRRERLHMHARHFDAAVHDVIDRLEDMASVYATDFTWVPMGSWHNGRVVIIGDARHGLSPVGGMGANLALEDASVLADELGRANGPAAIPLALERFAERRNKRVNRMREVMRLSDRLVLMRSPIASFVREKSLSLIPFERVFLQPIRQMLLKSF